MAYSVEITRPAAGEWNEETATVTGGHVEHVWSGRAEYVDDPVYVARYPTGDEGSTQSRTALVEQARVVNAVIFLPRASVHELVRPGDRVRVLAPTSEIRGTVEGLQRTGFVLYVATDTPQFQPLS